MRTLTPIVFILLTAAALPGAALAGDAEGCVDLKQLPRLEGCTIQECSAKQHESFDPSNGNPGSASIGPLDANVNTLTYACPASMDLERVKRELDAEIRKAGYQNATEDKTDTTLTVTARKGSRWLRWGAASEDGSTTYSLLSAEGSTDKFKPEACGQAPIVSPLKQCEVVECNSKAEDSVAMRTAPKAETSLTGNVQTLTFACPSITAEQAFSTAEGELKSSGFEILYRDREHPENGWMTGRAGNKWVELVSAPDGESVSYALTVVPSAVVLTASAAPEPSPAQPTLPDPAPAPRPTPPPSVPAPAPPPTSAPEPATTTEAAVVPPPPTPAPTPAPASAPAESPTVQQHSPNFVPPKPIKTVPIEATHDRIYSVSGDVLISLLVDVGEDGSVTKAVLTGRISSDVLKLQSAALEAVSHWRFEPARQDGRVVPAAKILVQMHFHGRPWRF